MQWGCHYKSSWNKPCRNKQCQTLATFPSVPAPAVPLMWTLQHGPRPLGWPLGTFFGAPALLPGSTHTYWSKLEVMQYQQCQGTITSHHIFVLPSHTCNQQPSYGHVTPGPRRPPRRDLAHLLPSLRCILRPPRAPCKIYFTEGLLLWLQLELKPALLLVSATQAAPPCQQPLMGSRPLRESRSLSLGPAPGSSAEQWAGGFQSSLAPFWH